MNRAADVAIAGGALLVVSPLLDLRILARTPFALFGGTYKGDTGGWKSAP